jgi:hypothetical protein
MRLPRWPLDHLFFAGLVKHRQLVTMIVRVSVHRPKRYRFSRDFPPMINGMSISVLTETLQLIPVRRHALVAAGAVFEHRLIGRWVYGKNGIRHGSTFPISIVLKVR